MGVKDIIKDPLGIQEIRKVLSHGYPMLLIDSVLGYQMGEYAMAKKLFSFNETFFQGHYDNYPIVPGVLLLEGLSQTAAFAILSEVLGREDGERNNVLFAGANRVRFFKSIFPGDCVVYEAKIVKNIRGLWTVEGKGYKDGKTCVGAEMIFSMM